MVNLIWGAFVLTAGVAVVVSAVTLTAVLVLCGIDWLRHRKGSVGDGGQQ